MKLRLAPVTVLRLVLTAGFMVSLIPISVSAAIPEPAKPYLKSFGADVMTGGWFMNGSVPCDTSSTSSYQDPSYAPSGYSQDNRTGGILAYAKDSGNSGVLVAQGGSSSQYGAFSLGNIEGSTKSTGYNWGFYSAGVRAATASTSVNALTFANIKGWFTPPGGTVIGPAYWGGQYNGSIRQQTNCVPDYYSKAPTTPNPLTSCSGTFCSSTASGVYTASAGSGSTFALTNSDVAIAPGSRVTIYVNGDVYIANNITYPTSGITEATVPKFALVVRGSIYIDPAVTELDGLYIAQPAPKCDSGGQPSGCVTDPVATDTGDIWTCHANADKQAPKYTDIAACTNKLTINGALIAKTVNFLRVPGDVGSSGTNEDTLSNAQSSANVSELINSTPFMDVGGPFFNPNPPSSLPIDSLISLPPIF